VLACYDKEIYYYLNGSEEDIDQDFFEDVPKEDFIKSLQDTRQSIAEDDTAFLPEEPFVLVHGDLHGRNIMMKDGHIEAILDWEFAGSYPLSELLGGMGVDVLEVDDDEGEVENNSWSEVIVKLAGEIANSRGWDDRRLGLLVGDGSLELQKARVEMFP
jgi:aminoglycoside phosphotransferase (APT) family kinase protein